jgi:hypothetical protein
MAFNQKFLASGSRFTHEMLITMVAWKAGLILKPASLMHFVNSKYDDKSCYNGNSE